MTLARENLQQDKTDKAVEIFATILKRSSANESAKKEIDNFTSKLIERFHLHLSGNEFSQARGVLGKLHKLEPHSDRLDPLRSKLEASEQQHLKESDFRGHFDAAQVALDHDNAPGAIEHLTKALTVNPSSPEAQTLLREARASYEKNRQKAEISNVIAEAEYYLNIHSYDMALAAIKKILDISQDPRAQEMQERIVHAMKEKEYRDAQKDRIMSQIQEACEQLNFTAAIEYLARGKELFPEEMQAQTTKVESYKSLFDKLLHARKMTEQGSPTEAVKAYEDFLQANPPYDYRAFYSLRQEAEDSLKAAREKSSAVDIDQLLRKSDVFLRMKQFEQARTEIKKIIERDPNHAAALAKLKEIEEYIPETRLQQEQPVIPEDFLKDVGSKTVQVPKSATPQSATVPSGRLQKPEPEIAPPVVPASREPQFSVPEVKSPKSSLPLPVIIGGAGLLAVAALLLFLLMRPSQPQETKQPDVKTSEDTTADVKQPQGPVVPALAPVAVSIDVQPWGNIEISGGSLKDRILETTPALVNLPPGVYSVRIDNSQFNTFTETISVSSSNSNFVFRFPQFNPDELADTLLK